MNIAIIPARGGSKRIYKKNIKLFCGKPIIFYSIEKAISSGIFDKVIVSTDDEEIAEIAIKYGAEVPFIRSKELSDDYTNTHEVVGNVIKFLLNLNLKIDYACCIYATAPLIMKNDIIKGLELIKSSNKDVVFSATNFSYPIFRSFKLNKNNGLEMFFPENYFTRSQDLPDAFHDAGQFYWGKPNYWLNPQKEYNNNNTVVLLPNWRVQDIDNLDDWKRAEDLYKLYIKKL
jgi:pseudaminic acid cytidylyltransferase